MIIRACAFTDKGLSIIEKLNNELSEDLIEVKEMNEDMKAWTKEGFAIHAPIVYVGAAGIAVRLIAPFVEDKLSDSPVIVIDEKGEYVIPILSGHVGGGNEMARKLAKVLGANPVITTATDVNGLFSVDVFAVHNGLFIENRDGIKAVSSKLLRGEEIVLALGEGIEADKESFPEGIKIEKEADCNTVPDILVTYKKEGKASLILRAKPYVIGIGCKKGTSQELISEKVDETVEKVLGADYIKDIAFLASIDLKARERGLLLYSSLNKLPLMTYSSDFLKEIKGDFAESDFVEMVTGVSNVCERAAMAAAGDSGELVLGKQANSGVTIALAKRKVILHG